MSAPAKAFLAYSHLDVKFRHELEQQLRLLSRKRPITWWGEYQIIPGEERLESIYTALEQADIVLILVSIHFLSDEFCWSQQLERAIQRHEKREAVVIPIYARACAWEDTPIERIRGVPHDARPVAKWSDRHAAWTDVARGIQRALDSWTSNRSSA
jgi:hypothetical protein